MSDPPRVALRQALVRRWRALYQPLARAGQDGFRQLDELDGLGAILQQASQALADVLAPEQGEPLLGFVEQLTVFPAADRATRVRLVALGLRLCAVLRPPGTTLAASPAPPLAAPAALGPQSPVQLLRGVGPATARHLAERGLATLEDLLYFLPLGYQDRRQLTPLAELAEGQIATARGLVVQRKERRARGRRLLELGLAEAEKERPLLWCVWFRAHPGLAAQFPKGAQVIVSGEVRRYREQLQMAHPDILLDRPEQAGAGIRCRYPEVAGVAPRVLGRLCAEACEIAAASAQDGVPAALAARLGLPAQARALEMLHLLRYEPTASELDQLQRGAHPAQRRLAFDELLSLQLAIGQRRQSWQERRAHACCLSSADAQRLRACYPFRLTGAQQRVIEEIWGDMAGPRPMHRLLQGDVGSGKTAVAFAAAYVALQRGLQAAVMAPTEILARQHLEVMAPWCQALGYRAALLTANTPAGVRESLLALSDAGELQLLIGTHALLSPRVRLPNLGLVVVDEQHRFGVVQRVRLRDREPEAPLPHLLVMTATPIPRTLALSAYGDLDLSLIDERPPGRRPPRTEVFFGAAERERAYARVAEQLQAGQQVFVVCPLVEGSDKLQVADAVSTAAQLAARFGGQVVGLVHGRLPPRERERVMAAFRNRERQLLVATTVIEVGIDIPRASVMVVEHAERFGLAQLHQLRGRVGRGEDESYCLLLSPETHSSLAGQRLAALAATSDGFAIAEEDLRLRGPGEVFGTRQSGVPRLRFADLVAQQALLAAARREATEILLRDPRLEQPEHQGAGQAMRARWEQLPLLGAEAG